MNKTKTALYIIILLLTALALFAFVKFSDGLFKIDNKVDIYHDAENLQNELIADGCTIFWIGEIPTKISSSGLNIRRVPVTYIREDTLPFYLVNVVEEIDHGDDEKEIINSVKEGYCPPNSVIVINNVSDLTADDYGLIIQSLSETNVPLYIMGEEAVRAFKNYMFMTIGVNDKFWSMKYTNADGAKSGVFDKTDAKTLDDNSTLSVFYKELLSEMTTGNQH